MLSARYRNTVRHLFVSELNMNSPKCHHAIAMAFTWILGICLVVVSLVILSSRISNISWTARDEEPLFIHKRAKYRVVFVRHGETEANVEGQFCGWCTTDITPKGEKQAKRVGVTLKKYRYQFDIAYTSFLERASRTLDIILDELGESKIEKHETWRLNERHTGALTGMNKEQAVKKLGERQIDRWRKSYDIRPPPMAISHSYYETITKDQRYTQDADFEDFPASENMEDVIKRTLPYWENVIVPQIKKGKRVLIVAHSSTLRVIVYHLEDLTKKKLLSVKVPEAVPFVYEFDEDMRPVTSRDFIPLEPLIVFFEGIISFF